LTDEKAIAQKQVHLQTAQANTQTKVCKRACFSPSLTKLFLKNFQRFKKNKKRNTQPTLNDTETSY
jgi:hypothetical protein